MSPKEIADIKKQLELSRKAVALHQSKGRKPSMLYFAHTLGNDVERLLEENERLRQRVGRLAQALEGD